MTYEEKKLANKITDVRVTDLVSVDSTEKQLVYNVKVYDRETGEVESVNQVTEPLSFLRDQKADLQKRKANIIEKIAEIDQKLAEF